MVEVAENKTDTILKIPKGFKQTEVGLIPEDWEVKRLCDISEIITGSTPPTNDVSNYGEAYLFVTPADLGKNRLITKTEKKLSAKGFSISRKFPRNSVLFTCIGSTIGKSGMAPFDLTSNQQINAVLPNKDFDSRVVYYILKLFSKKIKESAGETAVPIINKSKFGEVAIPLPPTLTEQTAIATALSDMDDLIAAQEQLIAKKRAIKQGAMQELLQPKEGWVTKAVSAIGKPFGGLSGKAKKDFEDGTSPYIPFLNVMTNPVIDTSYFDYVKIRQGEHQNQAQKGDLFFNGSSETPEEVGMCSVLLEETPNLYLNSFCFGFRFHKGVQDDGLFLAYYFRSSYGREKMYLLAQGATRFNLSKTNFLNLELELPEPEEQTRIARILSDMDTEIEQLGTQLAKYRQVKVGMMQELLTGKKRLIEAK